MKVTLEYCNHDSDGAKTPTEEDIKSMFPEHEVIVKSISSEATIEQETEIGNTIFEKTTKTRFTIILSMGIPSKYLE